MFGIHVCQWTPLVTWEARKGSRRTRPQRGCKERWSQHHKRHKVNKFGITSSPHSFGVYHIEMPPLPPQPAGQTQLPVAPQIPPTREDIANAIEYNRILRISRGMHFCRFICLLLSCFRSRNSYACQWGCLWNSCQSRARRWRHWYVSLSDFSKYALSFMLFVSFSTCLVCTDTCSIEPYWTRCKCRQLTFIWTA